MNKKQIIYHLNVNVNLMEESVIQINGGITINVDKGVKNIIHVKNIYLEPCYMQLQKWEIFSNYYG